MERMKKPKFIKEIEKSEGKERAKCGRWYIRVYGELDNKPMVELESLEIIVKELHKLEEENKKLKKECEENDYLVEDNARWMKECEKKTMEIKKLKSDLAFERTMLDNVKVEYESLQNVIKELNEDIKKIEENQEYRYHRCMVAERGGEDED